jgi:hypothetical protein
MAAVAAVAARTARTARAAAAARVARNTITPRHTPTAIAAIAIMLAPGNAIPDNTICNFRLTPIKTGYRSTATGNI